MISLFCSIYRENKYLNYGDGQGGGWAGGWKGDGRGWDFMGLGLGCVGEELRVE